MEVQPNLLAVNSRPPILATSNPLDSTDTDDARVEAAEAAAEAVGGQIIGGFFVSPLLRFDSEALAILFQVRDSESGEVTRQFPRESVVEELRQTRGQSEPEPELIGTGGDEAGEAEAPVIELATGPSPNDEAEVVTTVAGGTQTNNGAPAVAGSPTAASGLVPGSQSVDLLV